MNEVLMMELDKTHPRWAIEWADQRDLQALAEGSLAMASMRLRVANKLFHAILSAGVATNIVRLPS
jgi:hypothetical protein